MIKTVIFDLDGTLYDYETANTKGNAAAAAYAQEHFGLAPDGYDKAMKQMLKQTAERLGPVAATHNRLVRMGNVLENLGLPAFPHTLRMAETYWEAFLKDIVPFPGVPEVLAALKRKGLRVGIGSNMTAYVQYLKLEKLGVGQYMDFIVTSEDAGIEKPEPGFFEYCLTKTRCLPEECLFGGDNPRLDVEAARGCGMRAVLCGEGNLDWRDCLDGDRIRFGEICL